MLLVNKLSILNDVYCNVAVDVSKYIEIKVNQLVDFDDVLSAVLCTCCVLDDCNCIVNLVQVKKLIERDEPVPGTNGIYLDEPLD